MSAPGELTNEVLDDRFEILEMIDSGGMGTVYKAFDRKFEANVALKVMKPPAGDESEFQRRFENEIKNATAPHQNIVPIVDFGIDEKLHVIFLAMRLVDGPDLRRLLSDEGSLEEDRALRIFSGIGHAIEFLHTRDTPLLHRDIKPANILISGCGMPDEHALLSDFGIAKRTDGSQDVTQLGPVGTPAFMAPELFDGEPASARSDQFALACVIYQMLTGHPPFEGTREEIAEMHRRGDSFTPVEREATEVAQAVCDAIGRALLPDPNDRFESVQAFVDACDVPPAKPEGASLRLTPNAISKRLFGFSPDRDERASHIVMETLLTLWANDYAPPNGRPNSPKRRNGVVRSLALGENFYHGMHKEIAPDFTLEDLGRRLSAGDDFMGSDGLAVAQSAMKALVDSSTVQGSAGATLMLPFHESLLWFDGRQTGDAPWAIRKVNMRGTGVAVARMLLEPGEAAGAETRELADTARRGLRDALKSPSPLGLLAERLREVVNEVETRKPVESDEALLWESAGTAELLPLTERIVRHVANIVEQPGIPAPAKLLQVRNVIALDILTHVLRCSWEMVGLPDRARVLVLNYSPEARRFNRVRIASEESFEQSRLQLSRAIRAQISKTVAELSRTVSGDAWKAQFEARSGLDGVIEQLASGRTDPDTVASLAYEESRGNGYGRPVDAFRRLLESTGLLHGTGKYRYLSATPTLIQSLVGAIGGEPRPSTEFMELLFEEWCFVIGDAQIGRTDLIDRVDGGLLARNARRCEALLVEAGVAVALSDQTCMVGNQFGGRQ